MMFAFYAYAALVFKGNYSAITGQLLAAAAGSKCIGAGNKVRCRYRSNAWDMNSFAPCVGFEV